MTMTSPSTDASPAGSGISVTLHMETTCATYARENNMRPSCYCASTMGTITTLTLLMIAVHPDPPIMIASVRAPSAQRPSTPAAPPVVDAPPVVAPEVTAPAAPPAPVEKARQKQRVSKKKFKQRRLE